MIRFKNKYFPEFNIDPETGVITDQNGIEQEVSEHKGYLRFKGMDVHRIQAYTWFGYYGKGYDVHHIDECKYHNALNNLDQISKAFHNSITHKGSHYSEDIRKKMSKSHLGSHWFNNGVVQTRAKNCPVGFVKGRLEQ